MVSGAAVAKSLTDAGLEVTPVDVQRDMGALLTRLYPRPDAVFNALHGRFGEDGCVQGLLDILDIPYSHSGLLASALAMDKPMAKRLFAAAGIPVAEHVIAARQDITADDVMERPYVVKPLNEGSSIGVHIVLEGDDEPLFGDTGWPYGDRVMVEKFIPGRELTVSVMGDKALAVTEIITAREFYDYDAKYAPAGSRHVIPADIETEVSEEVMRLAVLAHQTLGCRGVSRCCRGVLPSSWTSRTTRTRRQRWVRTWRTWASPATPTGCSARCRTRTSPVCWATCSTRSTTGA